MRITRLQVTALSLLLGLLITEGVVRLTLSRPQQITLRRGDSRQLALKYTAEDDNHSMFEFTPNGVRLRPNTVADISAHHLSGLDVQVRTNSLGVRGAEVSRDDRFRILVLGDSITFADYVAEQDTYVSRMESALVTGGAAVQAINAGVGATSAAEYAWQLREIIAEVEPQLVFVGLYLNDFAPSHRRRTYLPPSWLASSWAANYLFESASVIAGIIAPLESDRRNGARLESEVARALKDIEPQGEAETSFVQAILESSWDWGGAWSRYAWEEIGASLENIVSTARLHGATVAFTLFPVAPQIDGLEKFDYPQVMAHSLAQRLGVQFIDVLNPLREFRRRDRGKLLYFDHCHFNQTGNALVGEVIAKGMKELITIENFGSTEIKKGNMEAP